MLRPDFSEILDYLSFRSFPYTLNTNGTLITAAIAQLLRRKGSKMVALYGATAAVHDRITRNPGSFETTMQGMAYLREAGAGFIVQLIAMGDNYQQFEEMVRLAQSLSPHYRVGAPWLHLSASRSEARNREIARQRLKPAEVVALDPPDLFAEDAPDAGDDGSPPVPCAAPDADDRLFAACIAARREFHVDPYGQMTFCCFIKDPALRYDLRRGTFQEAWEAFIPSLANRVRGGEEYRAHCGSCAERADCRWCAVYGYLERGRFSAPVPYLCAVARETRRYRDAWRREHRRCYQLGGITLRVEADLPISEGTFAPLFKLFEVVEPGDDLISIRHHFALPDLAGQDLGQLVYRRPPWAIYRRNGSWIYLGISPDADDPSLHRVAVFNQEHTRGRIHTPNADAFRRGQLGSLTLFPTDQILLARVLADRQGCYLHAAGIVLEGRGLAFVGHSGAGKSTMVKLLQGRGEILCDDRIIVRRWPGGWRIHGTSSHGEVPDVSPASAPLRALLFLEQAQENRLVALERPEVIRRLPLYVVKPLVTADWWEKTLAMLEALVRQVPAYRLLFDKSGRIAEALQQL